MYCDPNKKPEEYKIGLSKILIIIGIILSSIGIIFCFIIIIVRSNALICYTDYMGDDKLYESDHFEYNMYYSYCGDSWLMICYIIAIIILVQVYRLIKIDPYGDTDPSFNNYYHPRENVVVVQRNAYYVQQNPQNQQNVQVGVNQYGQQVIIVPVDQQGNNNYNYNNYNANNDNTNYQGQYQQQQNNNNNNVNNNNNPDINPKYADL